MSAPELIQTDPLSERATLEILWQQDVSATVLARGADGSLSAGDLHLGIPAVSDLGGLGQGASARRVGLTELIGLRPRRRLTSSSAARRERRSPSSTSPTARSRRASSTRSSQHGGRTWLAYWGATIDEPIQQALDAIAAALPEVCADAFDGDRDALVHDLYACAVDQIARDRLRAAGIRLGNRLMRNRPSAPELFLDGLTSTEPELPPHAGLGALERRLTDWVDRGLERRSSAPWLLSLRLDERSDDEPREDDDAERSSSVVLELWLQAADDPTLALPTSLLHDGGDAVFGFLRSADPRIAVHRQLGLIEPVLAEGGLGVRRGGAHPDRAVRRRRPVRAPHGDPAVRGARRAGAAAAQLGQLVEPPSRQPHGDERRRALERTAHNRRPRAGSTGSSRSATRR